MIKILTQEVVDELNVLLTQPDVRIEYHANTDCYVVWLNQRAIAADRDALTAAGQAWGIIQAYRAVAGLPPLIDLQQQRQQQQQWQREREEQLDRYLYAFRVRQAEQLRKERYLSKKPDRTI